MSKQFFQKIALINQLIGEDAPIASKVRAFIGMSDPRPVDIQAATNLALQAINFDAYGFGWHTIIAQHVDGPNSPALEITVGKVIDHFDLTYFLRDTADNGRQMSDEWTTLINTTK